MKLLVLKDNQTDTTLGFLTVYKVYKTNVEKTLFLQLNEKDDFGILMNEEEYNKLPNVYDSLQTAQETFKQERLAKEATDAEEKEKTNGKAE